MLTHTRCQAGLSSTIYAFSLLHTRFFHLPIKSLRFRIRRSKQLVTRVTHNTERRSSLGLLMNPLRLYSEASRYNSWVDSQTWSERCDI